MGHPQCWSIWTEEKPPSCSIESIRIVGWTPCSAFPSISGCCWSKVFIDDIDVSFLCLLESVDILPCVKIAILAEVCLKLNKYETLLRFGDISGERTRPHNCLQACARKGKRKHKTYTITCRLFCALKINSMPFTSLWLRCQRNFFLGHRDSASSATFNKSFKCDFWKWKTYGKFVYIDEFNESVSDVKLEEIASSFHISEKSKQTQSKQRQFHEVTQYLLNIRYVQIWTLTDKNNHWMCK